MMTRTSELALQALLVIGLEKSDEPLAPRWLAEKLDCSQSYLSKVLGMLVKAGLLRSYRGARGGVVLGRPPEDILLLHVVEACQGMLVANYCRSLEGAPDFPVCAFHRAMEDVHRATVEALSRWSLADLLARPAPGHLPAGGPPCKMKFDGWEEYVGRRPEGAGSTSSS